MKRYLKKSKKKIKYVDYVIIVASQKAKKELMEAFRHIHDSDVDTDFIVVCQLVHEYFGDRILVDKKFLKQFNIKQ